ncbi:hypothetical protein AVEN_183874-1 [Araneus ventricosus]|uniref:Uncharacterized protein n=1 Tax=Araneus ventricosus TaxID=182803 RepID=A0A4Y2FSI5_ARAVE|nr:hypothetical protein AVEN_183874-1 [Araneus ventricosus]
MLLNVPKHLRRQHSQLSSGFATKMSLHAPYSIMKYPSTTEIAGAPPRDCTTAEVFRNGWSGPAKIIPKSSTTAQQSWPNKALGGRNPHEEDTRDMLCRDNHMPEVIILCEEDGRSPSRIPEEATSLAPL